MAKYAGRKGNRKGNRKGITGKGQSIFSLSRQRKGTERFSMRGKGLPFPRNALSLSLDDQKTTALSVILEVEKPSV